MHQNCQPKRLYKVLQVLNNFEHAIFGGSYLRDLSSECTVNFTKVASEIIISCWPLCKSYIPLLGFAMALHVGVEYYVPLIGSVSWFLELSHEVDLYATSAN